MSEKTIIASGENRINRIIVREDLNRRGDFDYGTY